MGYAVTLHWYVIIPSLTKTIIFMYAATAGFAIGEMVPAINFCMEYPSVLKDVLILSLTSAIGQQFIYYAIHNVGSLNCSVITTSRKFWTLLASVFWNNHPLSLKQWIGVVCVFLGLGLDLAESRRNRQRDRGIPQPKSHDTNQNGVRYHKKQS